MDQDAVSDVVVFPNYAYQDADESAKADNPAIGSRYDVAPDLWIGPLAEGEAQMVLKACDAPDCWSGKIPWLTAPVELYSFVREEPPRGTTERWDEDARLTTCIALSRLVHPTSVGFHYAARVFRDPSGAIRERDIRSGTLGGKHDFAYVAEETRDWLTIADADELRMLMSLWPKSNLPQRITRAMLYCDEAAYCDHINLRWTLVATAIEALVHTDRMKSTKQFVKRVPLLMAEVGGSPISKREAEDMYEYRSALAHGEGLNQSPATLKNLYLKMEQLLRLTLLHAIQQPTFAQFLADPNQVKAKWPV
ncbi:MAG: hypothetical protein AB1696_15595 [Planctomycetota bacterium]